MAVKRKLMVPGMPASPTDASRWCFGAVVVLLQRKLMRELLQRKRWVLGMPASRAADALVLLMAVCVEFCGCTDASSAAARTLQRKLARCCCWLAGWPAGRPAGRPAGWLAGWLAARGHGACYCNAG